MALPYSYQLDWALDFTRLTLFIASRQIGKTHSSAGWAVIRALLGETTTIISVGEREAGEVLDTARKHLEILARLGSKWARPKGRDYGAGECIEIVSGGRIIALPASSGGRGYSGNVFLDEFAYHGNADSKIWDAAAGSATLGRSAIRIASTPNGVGNMFHELADPQGRSKIGISQHRVTIWDAVDAGYPIDPEECLRVNCHGDRNVFRQMYECEFLDGVSQYIPTGLIDGCTVSDARCYEGAYYAGLDLGLVNDLTCLVVLRQDRDGRVWLQKLITCSRTNWAEQMQAIDETFAEFRWQRLCVDRTGMGLVPAELLQTKYGDQRVEGVDFTNQSKEELATGLYQAFADRMIRIPRIPGLIADLQALRRTITPSGATRYDAPRTAAGHADRAWALALAIMACTSAPKGALPDYDPNGVTHRR